jgi:hypothetical protein
VGISHGWQIREGWAGHVPLMDWGYILHRSTTHATPFSWRRAWPWILTFPLIHRLWFICPWGTRLRPSVFLQHLASSHFQDSKDCHPLDHRGIFPAAMFAEGPHPC